MSSVMTPQLRAAILLALGWHETRNLPAVIYRLSFARIGQSGASFGALQADCHAWSPALTALEQILRAAKMPTPQLGRVLSILRQALPSGWPGQPSDLAAIDAAINSTQGRAAVDRLMQTILDGLVAQLGRCINAAAENGSVISPEALIGMAIWINQDGPPTTMLDWLAGGKVTLGGKPVPPLKLGAPVTLPTWLGYYGLIPFVVQHANQKPELLEAIAVGMKALGGDPPSPAGAAAAPQEPDTADALNQAELDGTLKPAA